jgi:hypothetical protein
MGSVGELLEAVAQHRPDLAQLAQNRQSDLGKSMP